MRLATFTTVLFCSAALTVSAQAADLMVDVPAAPEMPTLPGKVTMAIRAARGAMVPIDWGSGVPDIAPICAVANRWA